jgi:hypothetical protein
MHTAGQVSAPGPAAQAYLGECGVTSTEVDAQPAYRQPSAGATWVRMLSMTWAL